MSDKFVEIVDAETTVSEIAVPNKLTGYFAFYKNSMGKWDMLTQFDHNRGNHPILPYYAFESKQEAVRSAMGMKYTQVDFIKIVAVEFEV